eukprot:sb/3460546/
MSSIFVSFDVRIFDVYQSIYTLTKLLPGIRSSNHWRTLPVLLPSQPVYYRKKWILRSTCIHGQHTPKLKLKLKFYVFGHNSAISWRNCFFLGLLETGHQARSEELKKLEIRANCAANFAKKWQSYDQKRQILILILTLVCADPYTIISLDEGCTKTKVGIMSKPTACYIPWCPTKSNHFSTTDYVVFEIPRLVFVRLRDPVLVKLAGLRPAAPHRGPEDGKRLRLRKRGLRNSPTDTQNIWDTLNFLKTLTNNGASDEPFSVFSLLLQTTAYRENTEKGSSLAPLLVRYTRLSRTRSRVRFRSSACRLVHQAMIDRGSLERPESLCVCCGVCARLRYREIWSEEFSTLYYKEVDELRTLVRDCQTSIDLVTGTNTRVIIALRKGPTIGSEIVRNRAMSVSEDTLHQMSVAPPNQRCGGKGCKTCPLMFEDPKSVTVNGSPIRLDMRLTCKAAGVIYIAKCTICEECYFGQTHSPFHIRINGHRSKFKTTGLAFEQSALAYHMFLKHRSAIKDNFIINNFNVGIVKSGRATDLDRLEEGYIDSYGTRLQGLNRIAVIPLTSYMKTGKYLSYVTRYYYIPDPSKYPSSPSKHPSDPPSPRDYGLFLGKQLKKNGLWRIKISRVFVMINNISSADYTTIKTVCEKVTPRVCQIRVLGSLRFKQYTYIYKVAHGLLVTVSEVGRQNGDSCEDENYGSTLDQFLGNFSHNFLSKIQKSIFHSFIHVSFIYDLSILIFHRYAIFLWLEFIFPTSTMKTKLKQRIILPTSYRFLETTSHSLYKTLSPTFCMKGCASHVTERERRAQKSKKIEDTVSSVKEELNCYAAVVQKSCTASLAPRKLQAAMEAWREEGREEAACQGGTTQPRYGTLHSGKVWDAEGSGGDGRRKMCTFVFQNLGEHWISKDLCSQEKSRSKLKVHFSFLVVHFSHSGIKIPKLMESRQKILKKCLKLRLGFSFKVGFFEVVTPLGGARVFICASESCFGSHAFVSWPIWSNQSESKWGLSRANKTRAPPRGVTTSKNPTLGRVTRFLFRLWKKPIHETKHYQGRLGLSPAFGYVIQRSLLLKRWFQDDPSTPSVGTTAHQLAIAFLIKLGIHPDDRFSTCAKKIIKGLEISDLKYVIVTRAWSKSRNVTEIITTAPFSNQITGFMKHYATEITRHFSIPKCRFRILTLLCLFAKQKGIQNHPAKPGRLSKIPYLRRTQSCQWAGGDVIEVSVVPCGLAGDVRGFSLTQRITSILCVNENPLTSPARPQGTTLTSITSPPASITTHKSLKVLSSYKMFYEGAVCRLDTAERTAMITFISKLLLNAPIGMIGCASSKGFLITYPASPGGSFRLFQRQLHGCHGNWSAQSFSESAFQDESNATTNVSVVPCGLAGDVRGFSLTQRITSILCVNENPLTSPARPQGTTLTSTFSDLIYSGFSPHSYTYRFSCHGNHNFGIHFNILIALPGDYTPVGYSQLALGTANFITRQSTNVHKSSNFHNMFIRQFKNFWLLGLAISFLVPSHFAGSRQSGVSWPNWEHFCPQVSRVTCLIRGNQLPSHVLHRVCNCQGRFHELVVVTGGDDSWRKSTPLPILALHEESFTVGAPGVIPTHMCGDRTRWLCRQRSHRLSLGTRTYHQIAQKANLYYLQQTCPILTRSTLTLTLLLLYCTPMGSQKHQKNFHSNRFRLSPSFSLIFQSLKLNNALGMISPLSSILLRCLSQSHVIARTTFREGAPATKTQGFVQYFDANFRIITHFRVTVQVSYSPRASLAGRPKGNIALCHMIPMHTTAIRAQGSAHTKVKIKIKISILTSHTTAAVKISLPHSKIDANFRIITHFRVTVQVSYSPRASLAGRPKGNIALCHMIPMHTTAIRAQGSAHTKVKIKIKISILTSHTTAAVKISLPHSKSNDLARQFDGVLKFCHPTRPSKSCARSLLSHSIQKPAPIPDSDIRNRTRLRAEKRTLERFIEKGGKYTHRTAKDGDTLLFQPRGEGDRGQRGRGQAAAVFFFFHNSHGFYDSRDSSLGFTPDTLRRRRRIVTFRFRMGERNFNALVFTRYLKLFFNRIISIFQLRAGKFRILVLALTPLFLDQFRQTKTLRTHKIILFPMICGFLPFSLSFTPDSACLCWPRMVSENTLADVIM